MKLVSLNIEGRKHLAAVDEFLAKEEADAVALMEVFEEDFNSIAKSYQYRVFAPDYILDQDEGVISGNKKWGVAILSKVPFAQVWTEYYGDEDGNTLPKAPEKSHTPVLLTVDMMTGGRMYRVGTTHFTWTANGMPDERQRRHLPKLMNLLREKGEMITVGDFNIPREKNELYDVLAASYRDNIPAEIETTVDPTLHYANKDETGKLKLVVDYVWSTPKYQVSDVRVECGVSDHCAIVANVEPFFV